MVAEKIERKKIIINFYWYFMAGKVYNHGCNLSTPSTWTWGSSPKLNGFGKMGCDEMVLSHLGSDIGGDGMVSCSHCSTVERLYAWEQRLYQEVKVNLLFIFALGNFLDYSM